MIGEGEPQDPPIDWAFVFKYRGGQLLRIVASIFFAGALVAELGYNPLGWPMYDDAHKSWALGIFGYLIFMGYVMSKRPPSDAV